jgi:integrase
VQQLAARWSCSRNRIYALVADGTLRSFALASKRRSAIRIPADEVRRHEQARTASTGTTVAPVKAPAAPVGGGAWMPKRKFNKRVNVDQVTRGRHTYFRARLVLPRDPVTGIAPKPVVFYGKTYAEAVAKRDAWVPDTKPRTEESRQRLGDYLRGEYIANQELRVSTGSLGFQRYRDRKSRIERFILPSDLAQIIVGRLEPDHVEDFFRDLGKQKIGADTQSDMREDLRLALKALHPKSLQYGWRSFFDFRKYTLPTIEPRPKVLFDPTLVYRTLLDESKPLRDRALLAFPFFTACRPQDMWALTWGDLDLDLGFVHFTKKVKRTEDGWGIVPGSKTGKAGTRAVPLAAILLDMLRPLRGDAEDDVLLFTTDRGTHIDKDSMRYIWEAARKRLGLPEGPSLYSLKHLGNSEGARDGISAAVRAKLAGHTTPRLVETAYRVLDDAEVIAAVRRMDKRARRQGQQRARGTIPGTTTKDRPAAGA